MATVMNKRELQRMLHNKRMELLEFETRRLKDMGVYIRDYRELVEALNEQAK